MGSRRAIYHNIAPKPRFFSSEAKKFPRAAGRVRGPNLGLGAIPLYIALRDPIYTLHMNLHSTLMVFVYIGQKSYQIVVFMHRTAPLPKPVGV